MRSIELPLRTRLGRKQKGPFSYANTALSLRALVSHRVKQPDLVGRAVLCPPSGIHMISAHSPRRAGCMTRPTLDGPQ